MRSAEAARPSCACGGREYRAVLDGVFDRLGLSGYRFSVVRCESCGLARTLPVPRDTAQYEEGYSQTTADGQYVGAEAPDAHSELFARIVAERGPGPRVLDVGCHVGNFVAAARALGLDADGIDVDPLAVEAGQRLGRPVRRIALSEVQGPYDAVVLSHVLEHVADLREFLGDIARVLRPGGLAFVFVPHHRGLVPRVMGTHWMGWFPSGHVWHFTPRTLVWTVETLSPLRVVSCTTRGVSEPRSRGTKGAVKEAVRTVARALCWGDQIEAVFERS